MEISRGFQSDQRAVYDGLRVQLVPAPFLRRLLAYCVDLGILYCVLGLVVFVLIMMLTVFGVFAAGMVASMRGEHGQTTAVVVITAVIAALLIVLSLQDAYFIYYEKKFGATYGKRIFGLRVVSADGSSVTLGQAFVRDLMRYFDCFLVVPALLSIAFNKQNKRLGDLLAGTMVVYSEAKEESLQSLYLRHEEFEALSARFQAGGSPIPAVPGDVRMRYLGFAFPVFAARTLPSDKLDEWVEWVNGQCPALNIPGIPQENRNRFMAEICFKQERQAQRAGRR